MTEGDIIDGFDNHVASAMAIIGLGAFKAVENTVELIAATWLDVALFGLNVSVIAAYATVCMAGLTILVFSKTVGN